MHEKIRKEEKMSSFTRKKLRSIYSSGVKEAENEIKYLREALDCINQIRITQSEIRLLQQQTNAQNSHLESFNLTESSKKMRRGVLMSILQQAALTLPLWIGEIGQSAQPLCGRLPPEHNYVCKPGDKVAAIVKNSNLKKNNKQEETDNDDDEEEEDENWILAEVVAYHTNTGKYDVDDVDAEEGQERYTLGKKKIVPLPLWRANPFTDPDAIFPKDSFVLALYPQTTCFYRGIVSESPQTPLEDYSILFEDNTYPEGYSPPLNVPQLYVVSEPLTTNYHHKK
jgi:SAGA-associated factor 29